jgi:hypothetical protein
VVTLKELTYERALIIDKFWKEYWSEYSLPDDTSKIIDAVAVNEQERPIAYGQVKLFAELMLFQDMSVSHRDRADSLKLLMQEAFRGIDKAGLKECYCLIKDIRFARLISKHFGFVLVDNPGVLLVKRME